MHGAKAAASLAACIDFEFLHSSQAHFDVDNEIVLGTENGDDGVTPAQI
jgi:hypothetical protein